MESVDIDVVRERQKFIEGLKTKVDLAYKNRVQETHIEEIKNTSEAVEESRKLGQSILQVSDDTFINVGESVDDSPNQVSVINPHDYPDLLTISLQKLSDEGYLSENIMKTRDEILEHEFEHLIPALDQVFLKTKCSVVFIDDSKNFAGLRPSITLSGLTQVGVFKDIVGSAKKPSAGDKAHLGIKN